VLSAQKWSVTRKSDMSQWHSIVMRTREEME